MEDRVPFNDLSPSEKAKITYIDIQRRKAKRTLEKNKREQMIREQEEIRHKHVIDNYIYDRTMKHFEQQVRKGKR